MPAADIGKAGSTTTTRLAGEKEMSERKGEWRYEGGDAASGSKAGGEAKAVDHKATTPDFDGDGVREGLDEGEKPDNVLTGARDGVADDLKQIKGIGPKLEKAVNSIGVYHFDQIAAWTDQEVAWVNANLIGFKGRVTRDNWVEQAKVLAAGGETEFSKKVEKGGVYD